MGKKWLFFDIGSTLIDEELAYHDFIKRCVHQLQETGIDELFRMIPDEAVEGLYAV